MLPRLSIPMTSTRPVASVSAPTAARVLAGNAVQTDHELAPALVCARRHPVPPESTPTSSTRPSALRAAEIAATPKSPSVDHDDQSLVFPAVVWVACHTRPASSTANTT